MILTNTKARVFAIILALAMLFALVLIPSAAADEYESEGATRLVFSSSSITASDGDYTDYEISGTDLTIKGAGTYIVSGSCSDGSITVKKGTTGVTLVLNGLTLTSTDTAPLACNKSSGVTIVAASGSTNTLTDAALNNDDNYPDNELAEGAVIKCKDGSQVTLCGSGTLNIVGNAKNGIKSGATTDTEGEAWLKIQDLALNVTTTVNDGINAEAQLILSGGKITVSAADDGLHSDYVLTIGSAGTTGPTINIAKSNEGIEAASLTVNSGNLEIHSTDDGMNAANSDLTDYDFDITIAGGTVYIDTEAGDGMDSNGTLNLSGGTVEVFSASSGDNEPFDCDNGCTITGGTILGVGSTGMGIRVNATQPYVAFGGSQMGGGQMGGERPQGLTGETGEPPALPTGDRTPPEQTGETGEPPALPAGGSPGQTSGQTMQTSTAALSAGSVFTVTDSSGKTLYSSTAVRNAGYVFFSSASLTAGSSYTLTSGSSTAEATASAGSSGGGSGTTGQNVSEQPSNSGGRFSDVSEADWFREAAEYVSEKGLMNGVSQTAFDPYGTTSRGMIVVILYRLEGSPEVSSEIPFEDVSSDDYYANAVTWASENNIVTGRSDGTFDADSGITREQMASILYRYAVYKGCDTSGQADLSGFSDNTEISSYAKTSLSWANKAGIISGTDNGRLQPGGTASRAQSAAILMRFCNAFSDNQFSFN